MKLLLFNLIKTSICIILFILQYLHVKLHKKTPVLFLEFGFYKYIYTYSERRDFRCITRKSPCIHSLIRLGTSTCVLLLVCCELEGNVESIL